MLSALSRTREDHRDDQGFTLIELLVVIIIIGILAAIAVPVFLEQRKKGYNAAAQSDLRNLAEFEEIYLADFGHYGTGAAVIASEPTVNVSNGDQSLRVMSFTSANGYCLAATTTQGQTWYWDSEAGGLQPRVAPGCVNTYATTDGTPIT
jgi:type IV pilus assembly protein PilA